MSKIDSSMTFYSPVALLKHVSILGGSQILKSKNTWLEIVMKHINADHFGNVLQTQTQYVTQYAIAQGNLL